MKRVLYTGRVRLPRGYHSGDGRRLAAVDQTLYRDTEGRPVLPGSSLAGVLRADLHRLAGGCRGTPSCPCAVCGLMGPQAADRPARGDGEGETPRASRLYVRGGAGEDAVPRPRDRVGIDRRTRTAARKRKFDVEVAEGAVTFPFELRLDEPSAAELRLLETSLRRLAAGWLFLGGMSAAGLGRTELVELTRHELDLSDRAALTRYLLEEGATAGFTSTPLVPGSGWASAWEPLPPSSEPEWQQIRIALEIAFPTGFLVHDPIAALRAGPDHRAARRPDGSPYLPGSSLRGALRSRAEQILRTLHGSAAACHLNTPEACHERLAQERAAAEAKGGAGLSFPQEVERHCLACRVFGSGRLASGIKIGEFHAAAGGAGTPVHQDFVAIDRFTGGARGGAKFDAESVAGFLASGEIHLEVAPHRLEGWGLGLLALVLRDLVLGDVPLGFGTAKGFNEHHARLTAVERFARRCDGTLEVDAWTAPAGEPLDHPAAAVEALGPELQDRLRAWVGELHAVSRPGGEP